MQFFRAGLTPFLSIVFLLSSVNVNAELVATGYAKFSELSQEYFLTSISVDENAASGDAAQVKESAKRIEFKFLTKYSHRQFNRLLIERAAINSDPSLLSQSSAELAAFSRQIRGRFFRGDHLVIDIDDQGDVVCAINGKSLGSTFSEGLFDILLSVWIGPVPPSREFKDSLLGKMNYEENQTTFNSLSYEESRQDIAIKWSSPQGVVAQQANSGSGDGEKEVVQEQSIQDSPSQSQQNEEELLEEQLAEQELAAKQQAEKEQAAKEQAAKELAAKQRAEKERAARELAAKKAAEKKQLDKMVEDYASSLAYHAKKDIVYPKRSMRLGHTGKLMAVVTINRTGEITDMYFVSKTKYSTLNDTVELAIERAQPYPSMPALIADETFTFYVPVSFILQG